MDKLNHFSYATRFWRDIIFKHNYILINIPEKFLEKVIEENL